MRALLLTVGELWYAVDMAVTREVVVAPRISPLVTAPRAVLGLLNLRGDVVPVFDAGALLGVGGRGFAPFVVVVDVGGAAAGLAVGAAPETVVLGDLRGRSDLPGTVGAFAVTGARPGSAAAAVRVAVRVDPRVLLSADRAAG